MHGRVPVSSSDPHPGQEDSLPVRQLHQTQFLIIMISNFLHCHSTLVHSSSFPFSLIFSPQPLSWTLHIFSRTQGHIWQRRTPLLAWWVLRSQIHNSTLVLERDLYWADRECSMSPRGEGSPQLHLGFGWRGIRFILCHVWFVCWPQNIIHSTLGHRNYFWGFVLWLHRKMLDRIWSDPPEVTLRYLHPWELGRLHPYPHLRFSYTIY